MFLLQLQLWTRERMMGLPTKVVGSIFMRCCCFGCMIETDERGYYSDCAQGKKGCEAGSLFEGDLKGGEETEGKEHDCKGISKKPKDKVLNKYQENQQIYRLLLQA